MNDTFLRVDPAVDIVAPAPDTIAFLTPDGSFSMRDRHGLVRRLVHACLKGEHRSDLTRTLEGENERSAAAELIEILVARRVLTADDTLADNRAAEPIRDWIRYQGGVLELADVSIDVTGDGYLAQATRSNLALAGFRIGAGEGGVMRIIALDTPDYGRLLRANAQAMASGAHFLPAWLNRSSVHLGPAIIPGGTACLACLLHRQQAVKWRSEPMHTAMTTNISISPCVAQLGASLLSVEAVRMALDAHVHTDYGVAYQFELTTFRFTAGKVARLPHCDVCESAP